MVNGRSRGQLYLPLFRWHLFSGRGRGRWSEAHRPGIPPISSSDGIRILCGKPSAMLCAAGSSSLFFLQKLHLSLPHRQQAECPIDRDLRFENHHKLPYPRGRWKLRRIIWDDEEWRKRTEEHPAARQGITISPPALLLTHSWQPY